MVHLLFLLNDTRGLSVNRQAAWACRRDPQVGHAHVHIAGYKSLPLLPSDKRVAIVAVAVAGNESSAQQKNKPNQVAELHWTGEQEREGQEGQLDPSDIQSVRLSVHSSGR